MIEYINGVLTDITPTYAVIECNGVGFLLNINLTDYTALQGKEIVKLYVHESIREDAHTLWGFTSPRGREIFRLLTAVSGVGPSTARLIMSSLSVLDIENVIATGQESMLKSVKGIGAKTAQRIIVDLRDKIKVTDSTFITKTLNTSMAHDEALQALLMLGFAKPQSQKVLDKYFYANPHATVEEAVKAALKMM